MAKLRNNPILRTTIAHDPLFFIAWSFRSSSRLSPSFIIPAYRSSSLVSPFSSTTSSTTSSFTSVKIISFHKNYNLYLMSLVPFAEVEGQQQRHGGENWEASWEREPKLRQAERTRREREREMRLQGRQAEARGKEVWEREVRESRESRAMRPRGLEFAFVSANFTL